MNQVKQSHSDAFVFFGATGDLAYKQIFPALQALAARGHFEVPFICVARSGWSPERLKACQDLLLPEPHPLFSIQPGARQDWEKG